MYIYTYSYISFSEILIPLVSGRLPSSDRMSQSSLVLHTSHSLLPSKNSFTSVKSEERVQPPGFFLAIINLYISLIKDTIKQQKNDKY